jgi:hypothetical protein
MVGGRRRVVFRDAAGRFVAKAPAKSSETSKTSKKSSTKATSTTKKPATKQKKTSK